MKDIIRTSINTIISCNAKYNGASTFKKDMLNMIKDNNITDIDYTDDIYWDDTISATYKVTNSKFDYNGIFKKYNIDKILVDRDGTIDTIDREDLVYMEYENVICVRVKDTTLIVVVENRIYTKDLDILEDFNGYRFNHGLNAYSFTSTAVANAIGLTKDNSIEICCSYKNEYCGSIGVTLTGECRLASTMDLQSLVEDGVGRYVKKLYEETFITSPKEVKKSTTHGEAIVSNFKITSIWYKEDCDKDELEAIKRILKVRARKVK